MKKDVYQPVWVVLFAAAGVLAVAGMSNVLKPREVIPWRSDLSAARAEAGAAGKPVFAYFTAEWCGPCQSLKSTTWASKDVAAALRQYVPVKLDVDQHPELARRYGVRPIPAFVVLDPAEGTPRKQASGALPPDRFLAWLGAP